MEQLIALFTDGYPPGTSLANIETGTDRPFESSDRIYCADYMRANREVVVVLKKICFAILGLFSLIISACLASERQPIVGEMTISENTATIGKPFTVNYELSGGSGEFSQVMLQAVFTHTSRNDLGYIVGEFTSGTGSCTFIPPEGESMRLMLFGSDSSGREFYIHKNDIPLRRNPDFPVSFEFDHAQIAPGNPLTASYRISGDHDFASIELSWTILEENPEFPDLMDYSEGISPVITTASEGSVSYVPTFGDIIYLVVRGRDKQGNVFYEESKHITIMQSDKIYLPESLTRIEYMAFSDTGFSCVVFPDTIEFIAEDAFLNSAVTEFEGGNAYVKKYAQSHGYSYIE